MTKILWSLAAHSRQCLGSSLAAKDVMAQIERDMGEEETSRHGIFAIGDVRSKSTKRVAAAVGEGAQVVAALHSYLATIKSAPTAEVSLNAKLV